MAALAVLAWAATAEAATYADSSLVDLLIRAISTGARAATVTINTPTNSGAYAYPGPNYLIDGGQAYTGWYGGNNGSDSIGSFDIRLTNAVTIGSFVQQYQGAAGGYHPKSFRILVSQNVDGSGTQEVVSSTMWSSTGNSMTSTLASAATNVRFIRLEAAQSNNYYVLPIELYVYAPGGTMIDTTDRHNLFAQRSVATASSIISITGTWQVNPTTNIYDLDPGSLGSYSGRPGGTGADLKSFVINLGAPHRLAGAAVAMYAAQPYAGQTGGTSFEVETSAEGTTWTQQYVKASGNQDSDYLPFSIAADGKSAAWAQYLRISTYSTSGLICEFQVFETATGKGTVIMVK